MWSAFGAVMTAQLIKTAYLSKRHGFHWRYFFIASNMPSSHTATVTALALSVYLSEGVTTAFLVALFLGSIVVRDVIGDRTFAQQQEDVINTAFQKLFEGKAENVQWNNLIGHSLKDVFWGMALGIMVTLAVFQLFKIL